MKALKFYLAIAFLIPAILVIAVLERIEDLISLIRRK
jgi:hypothetical protein